MAFLPTQNHQSPSQKRRALPKSALYRFALAMLAVLLALPACSPVAERPSPDLTEPTGEPQPTGTATSEPVLVPEAILDQLPQLAAAGYRFEERDNGWTLINRDGETILTATETPNMISVPIENGQEMEFSAENYEVRETDVIGLPVIQVFKDAEGNIERFYLDKEEIWVTPLEIYNNFENLEQCPEINIEDVWNGRFLYSEALSLKPFPQGALESDGFVYNVRQNSLGYETILSNKIDGQLDEEASVAVSINKDNDYRGFRSCAIATTPNGVRILIGGEAINMKGGKIALMHYDWGEEVSWTEGHPYASQAGNTLYSVRDSFLRAREVPSKDGWNSTNIRPVIDFNYPQMNDINKAYGYIEEGDPDTAGVALYFLPQNDPLANHQAVKEQISQIGGAGENGIIPATNEQISDFQYMLFIGNRFPTGRIAPNLYFNASQ